MPAANFPPSAELLIRQILSRLSALESAAQTRPALNTIGSGGVTINGGNLQVLNGSIIVGVSGQPQIFISLLGGTPLTYYPTGRSGILNSSASQTIIQGAGTAQYEQYQILGAEDSTQLDIVGTGWSSSSDDGTALAQLIDFYKDPSNGYHFYRTVDYTGSNSVGSTTAVQPGTGTNRATPAVAETWHSAATLLNATWSVPTGALQYRKQADGTVLLSGQAKTTNAALASGAAVFTLPAGYLPTQAWYGSGALVGSTGFVQVEVTAAGVVTLIFSGTLNAPTISFDQVRFSTI